MSWDCFETYKDETNRCQDINGDDILELDIDFNDSIIIIPAEVLPVNYEWTFKLTIDNDGR